MKIGFIGLGNVGAKLSGSILRNGFDLTIHDLDKNLAQPFLEKGAHWADTPKEIAENCDMIITCLPSPATCAEVMEGETGILHAMRPGKVWAEMSTTDAAEMERLSKLVIATGARAVECPVSGGCHRADTGNISIFAGCTRETFEQVLPVLTVLGRRVLHTGEIGTASTLKVMTNYLATVNLVALGESLTTMKAAGIDLNTTYEAIRISSGNSFCHETESQVVLNGSREINFTLDLVAKDIGLFQDIADRNNVPLDISPKLIEVINDGIDRFGPREKSPNIIKRLEEATGLDITTTGFPPEMIDDEPEERGYEVTPKR
ncbi:MAG: 3-hydroxyisobutyrate dehydrogenase [Cocleimonas sp.]|jgi:3-hydroxyisobutyrate dehydrogenase